MQSQSSGFTGMLSFYLKEEDNFDKLCDFAKNVKFLIEKEYWGLYNMVCGGQTSRLEVTEELLDILGLKDKIKLNVVTSDYFKDIYFAERPPNERLDNRKLNIREANLMRDWKVSLREYIKDYYQDYL